VDLHSPSHSLFFIPPPISMSVNCAPLGLVSRNEVLKSSRVYSELVVFLVNGNTDIYSSKRPGMKEAPETTSQGQ